MGRFCLWMYNSLARHVVPTCWPHVGMKDQLMLEYMGFVWRVLCLAALSSGFGGAAAAQTAPRPSLTVTPSSSVNISGPQGGPFSPWSTQYRLSASTGTIKFAIAAPFWLRTPPRAGTISIDSVTAEPAGIKTLPSSLRSANNVHQRDQRLGQHTEDRKIDCRAIFTGLSPG